MKLLELQPLCFFLSLKRCTCGNNDRRGHRIGLLSCGKGYSQLYCMDMQINQKCVRHNRKLDPLSSVKAMQNDVTGQYIVKCQQNISFNRFQSFGLKCFFFFKFSLSKYHANQVYRLTAHRRMFSVWSFCSIFIPPKFCWHLMSHQQLTLLPTQHSFFLKDTIWVNDLVWYHLKMPLFRIVLNATQQHFLHIRVLPPHIVVRSNGT